MESHPVPQNITSFEFRLVGDMTLKQFMYLASGLVISYLVFIFLFSIYPYLAVPLIVIFTLLGVAFAFFPIGDRPLDHWVTAFFRAIYSPTQRFWISPVNKQVAAATDPLFKSRLDYFLISTVGISPTPIPPPALVAPQIRPLARIPSPAPTQPTPRPPQVQILPTAQIPLQPHQITPAPVTHDPHVQELSLVRQHSVGLQNKVEDLEKQLAYLKTYYSHRQVTSPLQATVPTHPMAAVHQTVAVPQPHQPLPPLVIKPPTPLVVVQQPKSNVQIKMSLTSTPNVINGLVADPNRNFLENVIVIIHNHEGLPVRALKTNKLGQFAGVTPLPDGIYTLNLEKEGFTFDTLQVTLNDHVLPPINVMAKSGGLN